MDVLFVVLKNVIKLLSNIIIPAYDYAFMFANGGATLGKHLNDISAFIGHLEGGKTVTKENTFEPNKQTIFCERQVILSP